MKGYPSAPTITSKVIFNGLPKLAIELPSLLQARVNAAAEGFRRALTQAIESGRYDLKKDTSTLIESIYVQTPHGSDYDERLKAALAAYLGNPSRWRDLVQTEVSPDAYTQQHFNARAADESELPAPGVSEAIAAVSTFWAVAFFWEFGHQNEFTGNYEHRPFMGPEADIFGAREYQNYFFDITRDFIL